MQSNIIIHTIAGIHSIFYTAGCIDDDVRCINASLNPTEENGAIFVVSAPQIASDGVLGWELFTRQTNWASLITIETSTDPDTYFLGPFNNGDDGDWSDTPTEFRQKFACDKDSIVNLEFTFYQCGQWEPGVRDSSIDVFFYGLRSSISQRLMEVQGTLDGEQVNFSTPILNAATNATDSPSFLDPTCNDSDWRAIRFGEGNDTIELTVEANQLFQVEFIIFTTFDNECGAQLVRLW